MKKIPTLFRRLYEEHKIIGITPEIAVGCEQAFLRGEATIKLDGSCCAIIDGKFYKRYDAKRGKSVPDGAIKCQDEADPITGHLPCWVKVDENNSSDKWFIAAMHTAALQYAFSHNGATLPDGTYEAVGKHFQGNPYQLNYDVLKRHGVGTIYDLERSFEGVHKWLHLHGAEGIVFWLDGEPVCKIKRSDFGLEWPVRVDFATKLLSLHPDEI